MIEDCEINPVWEKQDIDKCYVIIDFIRIEISRSILNALKERES